MKKTRKLIALLLASVLTVGGAVSVSAATPATASTPTSFSITPEMLGGDLVVTVPASLTLAINGEKTAYTKADNVNLKGNINPSKKVVLTTPQSITYIHKDESSVTAAGTVTFGTAQSTNRVEQWSAVELHDGGTTGVNKAISVSVPKGNVQYIGDYTTSIAFDIAVVNK